MRQRTKLTCIGFSLLAASIFSFTRAGNIPDEQLIPAADRAALQSGAISSRSYAVIVPGNAPAVVAPMATSPQAPGTASPAVQLIARPSINNSSGFTGQYTRATPIVEQNEFIFYCITCIAKTDGTFQCPKAIDCHGPITFEALKDSGGHSAAIHDPRNAGRITWKGQSAGVVVADGSTTTATLNIDTGANGLDGVFNPIVFSSPESAGTVTTIWHACSAEAGCADAKSGVQVQVANYPFLGPYRYSADRRGHLQIVTAGQSHPDAGYGQPDVGTGLDLLVESYANCAPYKIPKTPKPPQPPDNPTDPLPPGSNLYTRDPPPLRSEAISLQYGGIYDIYHNWHPSHVGHRVGGEIDIGYSTLNYGPGQNTTDNFQCLYLAIQAGGFTQPVPGERITQSASVPPTYSYTSDHTHIWNGTNEIQ